MVAGKHPTFGTATGIPRPPLPFRGNTVVRWRSTAEEVSRIFFALRDLFGVQPYMLIFFSVVANGDSRSDSEFLFRAFWWDASLVGTCTRSLDSRDYSIRGTAGVGWG